MNRLPRQQQTNEFRGQAVRGGAAAEADHSRSRKMAGDIGKEACQQPAT